MYVTLNIPNLVARLVLGWKPPVDQMGYIGISTLAYLSERDRGHAFLPAALWHDACYTPGASVQTELNQQGENAWPRWRVDAEFHRKMLNIAKSDNELIEEAHMLHLLVRKFYNGTGWQGTE